MNTIILGYLDQFVFFMNAGGSVMWVLFVLNLMLWYGLGYRYFVLRRGTKGNVRRLIEKHEERGLQKEFKGMLDFAIADALQAAKEAHAINKKAREYITDALFPYTVTIKQYSVLIKTIVVLAPLIGLLGTVIGMIDTFDALQSSSMFSQGTSISGGISKALFTTELGLVVAVPGLIFGRILDRKQERFDLEFEQITDIISTKEVHEI
jgi:biopolymer transport protein ExbB